MFREPCNGKGQVLSVGILSAQSDNVYLTWFGPNAKAGLYRHSTLYKTLCTQQCKPTQKHMYLCTYCFQWAVTGIGFITVQSCVRSLETVWPLADTRVRPFEVADSPSTQKLFSFLDKHTLLQCAQAHSKRYKHSPHH